MSINKGIGAQASGAAQTAAGQSGAAYSAISPTLNQWATNPTGYTPQQKANLLTAGGQSVGGSVAGAVGQGNLEAARTNNAGGYGVALTDAAHQGMVQNSANALGVQNQDAQLANQHQIAGLSGLQSIYNGANAQQLGALNSATNANTAQNNSFLNWAQVLKG